MAGFFLRFLRKCSLVTLLPWLAILFTGCKIGPDYQQPPSQVSNLWWGKTALTSDEPLVTKWWENFEDPLLNQLIKDATRNNYDVLIAYETINQAKANRTIVKSALFPNANLSASATRTRYINENDDNHEVWEWANSFDADLDVSWEIDFFGKNRRSNEAGQAAFAATVEDKRSVLLSIIAEVVHNYFTVLEIKQDIQLAKQEIVLLSQMEEIAKVKFNQVGSISKLELIQAQNQKVLKQALLPVLEANLKATIYQIAKLCGKEPESYLNEFEKIKIINFPEAKEVIAIGLKSDLLRRRPDIRGAERRLALASANIGVAKGALFPSITLTGSASSSAEILKDLFNSKSLVYSASSSIKWPIFAGGKLKSGVTSAKSQEKIALAKYHSTILQAVTESETFLLQYQQEQLALKELKAGQKEQEQMAKLLWIRYLVGEDDLTKFLQFDLSNINLQRQILEKKLKLLTTLTQLYKALGGGWEVFEENNQLASK